MLIISTFSVIQVRCSHITGSHSLALFNNRFQSVDHSAHLFIFFDLEERTIANFVNGAPARHLFDQQVKVAVNTACKLHMTAVSEI